MNNRWKSVGRAGRFGVVGGLLALFSASCGDDDGVAPGYAYSQCRFDPVACTGAPGGACRVDVDCSTGFCCTERANCGGGMCAVRCRGDADCPMDMACEHEMCFFRCRSNADCAAGQHCAHGHTVCEWP
jgi:hypothetical protein